MAEHELLGDDDDAFWSVALGSTDTGSPIRQQQRRRRSSSSSCGGEEPRTDRAQWFELLPGSLRLTLNALPERRGVLSEHLGSRAWHASAILACLLLQPHPWLERCASNKRHSNNDNDGSLTFLELGSGAVGLSGLALAALAARQPPSNPGRSRQSPRVILTDLQQDFDHHSAKNHKESSSPSWGVLSNLNRNVTENIPAVQEYGQSFRRRL
eukprot:scaffold10798_cov46-Attheya_sp.AAC.1